MINTLPECYISKREAPVGFTETETHIYNKVTSENIKDVYMAITGITENNKPQDVGFDYFLSSMEKEGIPTVVSAMEHSRDPIKVGHFIVFNKNNGQWCGMYSAP